MSNNKLSSSLNVNQSIYNHNTDVRLIPSPRFIIQYLPYRYFVNIFSLKLNVVYLYKQGVIIVFYWMHGHYWVILINGLHDRNNRKVTREKRDCSATLSDLYPLTCLKWINENIFSVINNNIFMNNGITILNAGNSNLLCNW